MSITGPNDIGLSKTAFFAGSLGIFSSGMLFGVYRVMRKENAKLNAKAQRNQIFFAARALGWGTVLCLGAFAGAGAVFSYTTKVTTLSEFDVWAKKMGENVPMPQVPQDAAAKAEAAEIEKNLNDFVESILSGKSLLDEGDKVESDGAQKKK